MEKQNSIQSLSREIADFLNLMNKNMCHESELQEFTKEYVYMIKNKEASQIIEALADFTEGEQDKHTQKAKDLIQAIYKEYMKH